MLSGGSFQVLLLLILVICISVFFFFELRKINLKITSQDILIKKITEDFNKLTEEKTEEQTDEIEMNTVSQDFDNTVIKKELNNVEDVSGGFSPTSSKDPVFMNPENILSEVVPLNDIVKESKDKYEDESSNKSDNESEDESEDESGDESENESHNDSDDDDSEREFDNDSDNSSELDIEEIVKELQEMSVKELKNILQEKGLAVSGNKTTMIERIINSLK